MPVKFEDSYINELAQAAEVSHLNDTTIAVDAAYYLKLILDSPPRKEPLLPALGGLTGLDHHIQADLDMWKAHNTIPFFIFDGQTVVGEEEVAVQRAKRAIEKTEEAWSLYFRSEANLAVAAFGVDRRAFCVRNLFPALQRILKNRQLHFLVAPSNAAAQLAHLDMVESDQCSAIMGSQELLLYPIRDHIIRSINWGTGQFSVISKKNYIRSLGANDSMAVDALLMTGTSFLPVFPPLEDINLTPRQPFTVAEAANILRTAEKAVTTACASFSDILAQKDPDWLSKYRKARMTIEHFVYADESGAISVHDHETLTNDNYEYLGYQLPSELFHYMNSGLISPRTSSWISHGSMIVRPTLDGVATEQYKKLVTQQLLPLREQALFLLLPRLNRGIQFKHMHLKAWFDDGFLHTVEYRAGPNRAIQQAHTWMVKQDTVTEFFPEAKHGSLLFELNALKQLEFAKATVFKEKKIKGIDSAGMMTSIILWRFLHLRGYVDDYHHLTVWGEALATALDTLQHTIRSYPKRTGLPEAVFLGFELIRYGLLTSRNQYPELGGLPMAGTEGDRASLLLISRCATLLKLHHQANGYTGPLSKTFLNFRSLTSSVREADRDLVEAIAASLLLHGQGRKDRDDFLDMSHRLPFLMDSDVALGIAVKTLLDDIGPDDTPAERARKGEEVPAKYFPYALSFCDDVEVAFGVFAALHSGVKSIPDDQLAAADKKAWDDAASYLQARR